MKMLIRDLIVFGLFIYVVLNAYSLGQERAENKADLQRWRKKFTKGE